MTYFFLQTFCRFVRELINPDRETEWLELKLNNANPEQIGEYISALSNSAALNGKAYAYMIWGVDDSTREVVGTTFTPKNARVGNEELENWLLKFIKPKIAFEFHILDINETHVVLLEIESAFRHPVQFKNQEFVRVGTYKKKLKDHPEKERRLWRIFDQIPFEKQIAEENLSSDDVLKLIDFPAYFDLLNIPLPEARKNILDTLEKDHLIRRGDNGRWCITNFGGILFARKLNEFQRLNRKSVRLIIYNGNSRINTIRELEGNKGYAVGFEGLIDYINALLPLNEIIRKARRENVPMYPELAIREVVANAIIHQDFNITGSGPTIEIFDERMEITNPGAPLVETQRFLDSPPRSRNEALASLMRRIGVCEERGSGIDKVVSETEYYQLPAPVFERVENNTRVILFAHKPFNRMDKSDKIRDCYLHACLKYVSRDFMTNSSLRERFGIEKKNSAVASRIIKNTQKEEVIRLYDPEVKGKYSKYVPFWA
ncbi:MAG: putative DNA binding domain-containing protein [Candidatus Omnitrophica bacterium]|nr:putative DNA binding domain-containing protein [Candidatus Omnitrophota bacterium]